MKIKSVKDLEVRNKTVLVRAGFDVPLKDGRIEDDSRIRAVLPTLNYLARKRAKTVIISHLGRPKGWDENLSLEPVASSLAKQMRRKLVIISEKTARIPEYAIPHLYFFKHNLEEEDLKTLIDQMNPGDMALLENLRFYRGEEGNDMEFAKKLARLGDLYVNEAFSASHREHASITALPKLLPGAAGLDLVREITALGRMLSHPQKPVVAMIGGIKLADKIGAIKNLARIAEYILLGGGAANLILKARGFEIGKSEGAREDTRLARELWRDLREKIKLPEDVVVASSLSSAPENVRIDKVKPSQMILDVGPATIRQYSEYLKKGRTLIWNGPLGYFEKKPFHHGSYALGRLFASRTCGAAYGIAGGGETLAVLSDLGMDKFIDHVSTGGGAMLAMLAGQKLPGIQALEYDYAVQAVSPNYS